jgi:antitoxin ParD1/3/4
MPMTINVRVSGVLADHVAEMVGEHGSYENVSEYIRDLIRKDWEQAEEERFQTLKNELQAAFATPDSEYEPFDVEEFLARMKQRAA